jgi:predicted ATPase/class 3 adenylate cyclase
MAEQPSGTVTLLFSDIEGSTRLLEALGRERYAEALARHRDILRGAFAAYGGYEVDYEGDAFFVAFPSAIEALAAAVTAQRGLAAEQWPDGYEVRVRIGVHTGEPLAVPPKYVGLDVHRAARIMAAGHGGQVLLSQRTASLVEDELPDGVSLRDLGEHRLQDLSSAQRLHELAVVGLPSNFPPLKTLSNRPTNLPAQPNRLIGRTEELAAVTARLRERETRLLTLTGPGGTGKTRLALHAGAELLDDFPDGVFVVFLASLRDPQLVVSLMAQTLGLRERAGETTEEILASYLKQRRALILLDNLEHLLEAGPAAARLLAAAPNLSLLVTSREPLRLAAERLFDVQPLSAPEEMVSTAAAALEHDSVALFVERASAAKSDFALSADNAGAVAELCARLDGLPLAIELAAARIRTFSPGALVRRLDQRFTLLTSGTRDADERQRTLQTTIEWSHDLLSAHEATLFARLAVFRGGCRIEDAGPVCDPGGELCIDLPSVLSSLVDKSLLRQREDRDGEPRFWMLETIREYALERLRASGAAEAVARRHTVHFVALAEHAEQELRRRRSAAWIDRLETEHDNLRAVVDSSLAAGDVKVASRLLSALLLFWKARGHVTEARHRLAEVLARDTTASVVRAKGLWAAGCLATVQGEYGTAVALLEESAQLFEELREPDGLVLALAELAFAHACLGDHERAKTLGEESVAIARERGGGWLLCEALNGLAVAFEEEGDLDRIDALLEECVRVGREAGYMQSVSRSLNDLGCAALIRNDLERAVALLDESLAVANELGDIWFREYALANRGWAALLLQDLRGAAVLFAEELTMAQRLGDGRLTAEGVQGLAAVAAAEGRAQQAAQLYGTACALREVIGAPPWTVERAVQEQDERQLREDLGDAAFASAWAEGWAMTREQAIAEALAQAEPGCGTGLTSATPRDDGLTGQGLSIRLT